MPFTVTPNVAQYGGANWSNFIKTVPNCTPQSAQRIARADPNIGFFFYCRGVLVLDGHPQFNPGDAVFFSGAPWPGSAPQADIYQKDVFTMAYVMTNTSSLANAGCYTLADGRQFFDFVSVFAANLDGPPNVPVLTFTLPVNASLYDTDDVKKLQNLGITVLLSVVNNWSKAGWSEFTDQTAAQWFVDQLVAAVDRFGLDGIDIDDEYSIGTPTDTNLAMVTTLLRQALPGKIVSKALFDDSQYFGPTWNGHTLTGNLTYGWDELLRSELCRAPPTLCERRHGQEPARDRRRYEPHRRPRRGELRPAERIRRHHGVQRDEGFRRATSPASQTPSTARTRSQSRAASSDGRPRHAKKARGEPRALERRSAAWLRLQPDAAPSTLAGSTFTPGPMVEEIAMRWT